MAEENDQPAENERPAPPTGPARRAPAVGVVRKVLFYAVVVAFIIFILGSIGTALQIIYVKMAHPSRPQDQTDQEQ